MTAPRSVTVANLQSRPETLGLDLETVAGGAGLERRITSPYVRMPVAPGLEHQLQLAGMDELDESEIEDVQDSGEES